MYTSDELYMAQTENLEDDLDFYFEFCRGKKALELFAGFGRVSNPLIARGCDIETVELNRFTAKYIELPSHKNHICDVRDFSSEKPFDRIFAAYNSFPLLTDDNDIRQFFVSMSEILNIDGQIALNIYHPDWWEKCVEEPFKIDENTISYSCGYNLENRFTNKTGQWLDYYELPNGEKVTNCQTVKLYEHSADFLPYLKGTGLAHIDSVINYNRPEEDLVEPGWIDFIFKKQG